MAYPASPAVPLPIMSPFFAKHYGHSSGPSVVVTTRLVAYTPDPRANAPAIRLTAPFPPSTRDTDAFMKRKREDPPAGVVVKRRRVSPAPHKPHTAQPLAAKHTAASPSPSSSSSSRYTSVAPSSLSPEPGPSSPSTRATSVASMGPSQHEGRKCWIDADGKPGPGFVSSELVVQRLMKRYKRCEYPFALCFSPTKSCSPRRSPLSPEPHLRQRFLCRQNVIL